MTRDELIESIHRAISEVPHEDRCRCNCNREDRLAELIALALEAAASADDREDDDAPLGWQTLAMTALLPEG